MQGKHSNVLKWLAAWVARERLRKRLRGLVRWDPLTNPEPGCTVVLGMCSRLPHVLLANLRCLAASHWPDFKELVIAVDCRGFVGSEGYESTARKLLPGLPIRFLYYSETEAKLAEQLKLPYVYSWLSWCLAIRQVKTEHILIHDYDALILGRGLEQRYEEFCRSKAKVQGISWYAVNGFVPADRLVTTFEQFCDVVWLRSLEPLDLFNKVGIKNGRSVDYDTTLDIQDRLLTESERQMTPMNEDELVHPSQMIHQYTMFRRHPAKALPCFAMPMIPFFSYLGGFEEAIRRAASSLERSSPSDVDLLGDATRINLTQLNSAQVDWSLKQMVQTCLKLAIPPQQDFYQYGLALYKCVRAPASAHWVGDFTPGQRRWISLARES